MIKFSHIEILKKNVRLNREKLSLNHNKIFEDLKLKSQSKLR